MQYSERTSSRTICFQQRTSGMCKEASNFVPWSNEKLQGMHCIISRATSNCSFSPPPLLCSRDYIVYCTASNCFTLPCIALLTLIFASKECHTNFTSIILNLEILRWRCWRSVQWLLQRHKPFRNPHVKPTHGGRVLFSLKQIFDTSFVNFWNRVNFYSVSMS